MLPSVILAKGGVKGDADPRTPVIIIGLGSNLPAPDCRSSEDTVRAALAALPASGIEAIECSPFYLSEPVPRSDQPWFVNAVAAVATALTPVALLSRLLALERHFGRRRGSRNAARTLDLDLLDYDGRIIATANLALPHPRLHERRFVLTPLCDIVPGWRHPLLGTGVAELLAALPAGQPVHRLAAESQSPPHRDRGGDCG